MTRGTVLGVWRGEGRGGCRACGRLARSSAERTNRVRRRPLDRLGTALALLLLAGIGAPSPLPAQESAKPGLVLDDTSSYWRVYYVMRSPVVRTDAGVSKLPTQTEDTPVPPEAWTQTDFDDSQWARVAGKPLPTKPGRNAARESLGAGITEAEGSSPALALICMRGKFGVADPSAVQELKLSVAYRGGIVAYVNGTEIGRASLPRDASGPGALAHDYPKAAFFKPDGSPEIAISGRGGNDPATIAAFAARVRSAEISVPSRLLRKGANVLAIEVHRAAYLPGMAEWFQKRKMSYQLYGMMWATCGLNAVALQSASPAGLIPNLARPKGFQVWNSQPMQPDFDLDYGDPFEPLRPIGLVGSRGGVSSGKIVVGSDQPIRGLKAQITDLAGSKGDRIPSAAVQVRYALPTGEEPVMEDHFPAMPDLCDGLSETAPATVEVRTKRKGTWCFGAVCPVWVTVAVPEKSMGGDYTGRLTLSAEGQKTVEVPVTVKVSNWLVPKPSAFHTAVDLIQSPETVAMQYNVPIYSDRHFQLLEKSLARAGYVGTWTLHLPLICQSNLGNEQSMVRWIKQPDGSYAFDFTPLEKYLDLAEKHMGKPRAIDLVVWDLFLGFSGLTENPTFITHNTNLTTTEPQEIPVSMLDKATGRVTTGTVGRYDAKGKPNWKALAGQLMERLKQRGLDKSLHIGHSYDLSPTDEIVGFWNELLPGVHYFRYGHYDYRTFGKTPAGISDFIVHEWAPSWNNKPVYGWKRDSPIDLPWIRLRSERGTSASYWKNDPCVTVPVSIFRLLGEACIQGPYHGFGRMGLDYWPVLENEKGQKNALGIQGRYPNSSWRQSDEMILCLVPPGPDGALSSSKLEMMREGLQETEARILLEGALTDPAGKGRMPAALTVRAQAVLDGRVRALQMLVEKQPVAGFDASAAPCLDGFSFGGMYAFRHSAIFQQWFMASGWQARAAELFDVAAEVDRTLR